MNKKAFGEIFFSIIIAIVALLLIFFSEKMLNLITTILGISLVLYAIYNLFVEIKKTKKSLISITGGVVIAIIGVLLLIHPSFINEFISLVIGIYILLNNISKLLDKNNKKTSSKILAFVGIIIGILCIVGKFLVPSFILELSGIFLLLGSIITIVETILMAEK